MSAIENMLSRVSVPRLGEPAPTSGQLETMLQCALRAPDHGQLRPWRFLVIEGEARKELGEIFAEARKRLKPEITTEELDKIRLKPLRAPVIIVGIAKVTEHEKIPAIEMTLSMGAAVEHIMLAAHDMGFGAMWRTGAMAFDPYVKQQLGCDEMDEIVGYVYLGTIAGNVKAVPALAVSDFAEHWKGR